MAHCRINFNLRPHQLELFENRRRFECRAVHRRFGKTFLSVCELIIDAIQSKRDRWQGFYIAPTYTAAKSIAWGYIHEFCDPIPGCKFHESELKVTFPNRASIQLLGAERYDTLRGRYADAVVLDETAQIPGAAWHMVLSPMLADRKGRATFIGTPAGRMNLFYELFEYGKRSDDPEWRSSLLTYQDTDVLDPSEVARMKRTMREEEFAQELLCSWNAALRGAFYQKSMTELDNAGRITSVKYDAALPVSVALDLGWSDAMVATFWQQAGTEHRCINCETYEHTSLPDMVRQWRDLPYPVSLVILPHDAKVHELGTGQTRQNVLHQLGCTTRIAPNQGIHEGIEQVRVMLKNTWLDKDACKTLIEALLSYKSEYDEVRQVHKMTPTHNWASHFADSVRYYAIGRTNAQGWGPRDMKGIKTYA